MFWHLLRADVIVRVGFPPPRFSYQPYDETLRADRRDLREQTKRILFRTSLGRGLRSYRAL